MGIRLLLDFLKSDSTALVEIAGFVDQSQRCVWKHVDKDNESADTCVKAALANVTREAFNQEGEAFLRQEEFKADI